jgi:hypothetical protein
MDGDRTADVQQVMDQIVAALRGRRCYWWVVIRCWLWVVVVSVLAISSAFMGLSSHGRRWPLTPNPGVAPDSAGPTTMEGIDRIGRIWPWALKPLQRPGTGELHPLPPMLVQPFAPVFGMHASVPYAACNATRYEEIIAELRAQLQLLSTALPPPAPGVSIAQPATAVRATSPAVPPESVSTSLPPLIVSTTVALSSSANRLLLS